MKIVTVTRKAMATLVFFAFFGLLMTFYGANADQPCAARKYNHSSVVCVCNSTYCDEISKLESTGEGRYILYSSSMEGLRFQRTDGLIDLRQPPRRSTKTNSINDWLQYFIADLKSIKDNRIIIDRNKQYQTINGFGGSFTDANGINVLQLSRETQEKFMRSYFSNEGLEYNMCRVPIGGTDFSDHPYAYNMEPEDDVTLSNFSLAIEDFKLKIPFIKRAKELASEDIYLVSTAWSPPLWMKTNHAYGGVSRLIGKYYQTWADYHLKFLKEYNKENITFWAMSTGNEPSNGIIPIMGFNSLGWMPREQAKWVSENLGPTLRNSEFSNINILALDDQRFSLPWWIEWMNETDNAMEYINGIATHWYWDDIIPPRSARITHDLFPNKFLVATEACVGDKPWQLEKVELGSWERGEMYINNILQDLNHWYTGWIDWNLALDRQGGPNWYNNFVDSPVITMPGNDEFLKQPLFYAMGHFSKFIPRGSKRVSVERVSGDEFNVAFLRPDGGIAVIFYNPFDSDRKMTIQEEGKGTITIDMPKRSVHSLVYW